MSWVHNFHLQLVCYFKSRWKLWISKNGKHLVGILTTFELINIAIKKQKGFVLFFTYTLNIILVNINIIVIMNLRVNFCFLSIKKTSKIQENKIHISFKRHKLEVYLEGAFWWAWSSREFSRVNKMKENLSRWPVPGVVHRRLNVRRISAYFLIYFCFLELM